MQIKIRKQNQDGIVRMETSGEVKEILINEDILHPNKESISICFRGKSSSGIIDMTPAEIEQLYQTVRSRMHLIKAFKTLNTEGTRVFKR
ncbi:MAG: hypothetical protein GXP63_05835 [DPANN group archaeon]|nr:hypothetical protein [DPANN group archaeon]